jgi:23S rRNA pseudouridine2605 synthase
MNEIRLQKIIADSGCCSRRKAEAYIEQGLVKVNGRVAKIGDKARPYKDIITVDGKTVKGRTNLRYIKMYKPRGFVCTMSDPHAADGKLISDLLKSQSKISSEIAPITERVYPIGRLDAGSEGLILLTNDGAFANKIAHPSNEFKKTYRVTVAGKVSENQLAVLAAGVNIGENGESEITRPCSVEVVTSEEQREQGARKSEQSARKSEQGAQKSEQGRRGAKGRTVLLISISEGKNRQIRRMCAAVGLDVSRLKRVSIGGVKLGMLQQGQYADLTKQELRLLGYDEHKSGNSGRGRRGV